MAEDWARGTIKETPFWRDGMSVEEYEEERNYLMEHWRDLRQGTYYPFMETTRKIIGEVLLWQIYQSVQNVNITILWKLHVGYIRLAYLMIFLWR